MFTADNKERLPPRADEQGFHVAFEITRGDKPKQELLVASKQRRDGQMLTYWVAFTIFNW